MNEHFSSRLNEYLKLAREKVSFVDTAAMDPAAAAGGGDPAAMMAGGAPMDPAAMGIDPAMLTGGGGGGFDPESIRAIIQEELAKAGGGMAGGGAGGAGGVIKPKIDVNVEIMQIKNILAKIADTLGVPIPAQDMVATPDKLTAMAQGQPTTSDAGGMGNGSAIQGIQPMPAASPDMAAAGQQKTSEAGLLSMSGRAAAIAAIMAKK